MGMILRIASSRIVGQGDIVGRSGYFSLNLSANSVMRGRLDARRTLKSLVADLRITSNKKQFLDLLLLADEQESMIDKYLERGEMFALYDDGLKAISVVTCEGEGIYEIKNIAVCPSSQRKGYGKRLVDYLFGYYQGRCSVMLVGTGDTPSTLSFYEHCGFRISHRLKNFFTDNYDHPIYEDGKLLTDMVYLRKDFS